MQWISLFLSNQLYSGYLKYLDSILQINLHCANSVFQLPRSLLKDNALGSKFFKLLLEFYCSFSYLLTLPTIYILFPLKDIEESGMARAVPLQRGGLPAL